MVWTCKLKRSIDITKSNALFDELIKNNQSDTGETVTEESALSLPAFQQSVKLIAGAVRKCDCLLMKYADDGSRTPDYDHPVARLLNQRAGRFKSAKSFRHTLVANALVHGNGYAIIHRDGEFRPEELQLVDPKCVTPQPEYDETGRLTNLTYLVTIGKVERTIPFEDMFHISNLAMNEGLEGASVIDRFKQQFALGSALERFGNLYFRNGSHVNRVLKVPGWLTAEQEAAMKSSVNKQYSGLENSHKMMILMGGTELHADPINNDDAQFNQSKEQCDVQLGVMCGIPAHKVGADRSSSYGSIAEENQSSLSDTYEPWLSVIEDEAELKLLNEDERLIYDIEFDRSKLLDGMEERKMQLEEVSAGVRAVSECRSFLKLPAKLPKDMQPEQQKPELEQKPEIKPEVAPPQENNE
jgi:HK97 family phage portal protein